MRKEVKAVSPRLDHRPPWESPVGSLIKAVGVDMLPSGLRYSDRFELAARAGFGHLEMHTVPDRAEAEEVGRAARQAGLKIHAVVVKRAGRVSYYAGEAEGIEAAVAAALASLRNAALWGADVVLLIPGLVRAGLSYEDVRDTSRAVIRERILPVAADLKITLGIENVWHGCLLSPTEYVAYVDEFESPWVRAYLDVGNMIFGHPEHWIRTAGTRIVRVHLKDFGMAPARRRLRGRGRYRFARLGEGAVDWRAVRRALREVGFGGQVTNTGVPGGLLVQVSEAICRRLRGHSLYALADRLLTGVDVVRKPAYAAFLQDVSTRFDRFEQLR